MKQLTLSGLDKELERRLKLLAERENLSLNKTIMLLLRKATGLEATSVPSNRVGPSLEEFVGVWSPAEQQEFDAATRVFNETGEAGWESFFLGEANVSDDFMQQRSAQSEPDRIEFGAKR